MEQHALLQRKETTMKDSTLYQDLKQELRQSPKWFQALSLVFVALGVLCVFFGMTNLIFKPRHIGVLLLFLVAGALFLFPIFLKLFKNRPFLRRLFILLYCLAFVLLSSLSIFMVQRGWFAKPPTEGEYTVVVLGAALSGERPSRMLQKRLDVAIKYLEENPKASCIVTGGQGPDEVISEALAMSGYLEEQGIPSSRIVLEDASTTTRENLKFAQELIPSTSKGTIIVTDGFHQARAYLTAKDLGLEPLYALSASTDFFLLPGYWLRDLAGIVPTWLEIQGLLPSF